MKFKGSPYRNKDLLGESFYYSIGNSGEIFTVQEYFGLNDNQKEYHVNDEHKDYNLNVFNNYYELDCQKYQSFLYLFFDKPVHIIGKNCIGIIAPEIIVKNSENDFLSACIANNIIIHNNYNGYYKINYSKSNSIYFYNSKVNLWNAEINNFFIFDEKLKLYKDSGFLDYCQIKCFGKCDDLKKKILKDENFQNGIIHIE